MSDEKLLTKIGALLRKAEKTDNEHEADAFLKAAQRLATASSIDLAVARAKADAQNKARTAPIQKRINLGEKGKRGLKTFAKLFIEIGDANDLKMDIARDSTAIFAFGFESDIEVAEALYGSLVTQMVMASSAYLKTGEHKTERVWNERKWEYTAPSGSAARISFQESFARRIGMRLRAAQMQARNEAAREAEKVSVELSAGTDLAIRNKEIEVHSFHKATSRARGSWNSRSSAASVNSARERGDDAGRKARLGAQGAFGGARGALGA